jgi:hypothetical protein
LSSTEPPPWEVARSCHRHIYIVWIDPGSPSIFTTAWWRRGTPLLALLPGYHYTTIITTSGITAAGDYRAPEGTPALFRQIPSRSHLCLRKRKVLSRKLFKARLEKKGSLGKGLVGWRTITKPPAQPATKELEKSRPAATTERHREKKPEKSAGATEGPSRSRGKAPVTAPPATRPERPPAGAGSHPKPPTEKSRRPPTKSSTPGHGPAHPERAGA